MENQGKAAAVSREEVFFEAAMALPAEEREGFLEKACGTDRAMRQRVEALLKAHGASEGFLEPKAVAAAGPGGTIVVAPAPTEGPGDVIGRYKIREKLGEGGCGVVYVAEQSEPVRRRVALKVIKLGMDTQSVIARFNAERQALAMMDHPNIAKVLDAGTTEAGRPYFVMELVRGIRITDYCDQNNLNTAERIKLFVQVCHAVQHAHQKGIIHRDLKPSNILVTLHDGEPVPKVIDFGIAKATEGRLSDQTVYTQLYEFIGTPAYISPEQAEMSGLDIDTRSDIYSLGVLLYELLTGQTPFDAQELVRSGLDAMRKTIRELEPPAPSTRLRAMVDSDLTATAKRRRIDPPQLVHFLKGDLDWIVMKALEKDRTRRYETATGLAADLKRFLENEPVEARPPSPAYRFQKLIRRNKIAFTAAGGILAALALGLAIYANLFVQEKEALRELQKKEAEEVELRQQAERGLEIERKERALHEIGLKLWQAGVLMSQEKFDDAEAMMRGVPRIPQCAAIYNVLGMYHARWRRLDRAITNYALAATVQPTNDAGFHYLLPLLAEAGRTNEYDSWRSKMLAQFAGTADAEVAEHVALDCLLLPPDKADLEKVTRMIDTTENGSLPGPPRTAGLQAEGFAEYRRGDYGAAVTHLKKALESEADTNRIDQDRLLLDMAQTKLGQAASEPVITPGHSHLSGPDWNDQTTTFLLAEEAEAMGVK